MPIIARSIAGDILTSFRTEQQNAAVPMRWVSAPHDDNQDRPHYRIRALILAAIYATLPHAHHSCAQGASMITLTLHGRVAHGTLEFDQPIAVPTSVTDGNHTVLVAIADPVVTEPLLASWPADFFDTTFGSCPDLERPDQGVLPED